MSTSLDSEQPDTTVNNDTERLPRALHTRLGIVLISLSGVLWFSLFAIPFLPLTLGQKTAVGGGVFVSVQIAWWAGAALVGPQAIQNMNKWFRKLRSRWSAKPTTEHHTEN